MKYFLEFLLLRARRGLGSAIVVLLLAVIGIVIATVAIKFLTSAAAQINVTASERLGEALIELGEEPPTS